MSLEEELRTERVSHLDLSGFTHISSGTSIRNALNALRADKHNVALITDGGRLIGIFTDRDVLRKVAGNTDILDEAIDTVMTRDPITVSPETSAADALKLMDEHHFRNLPAVDANGVVIGDMTHQAVIHYLAARYPQEVLNRPPTQQFPRKAEGG